MGVFVFPIRKELIKSVFMGKKELLKQLMAGFESQLRVNVLV